MQKQVKAIKKTKAIKIKQKQAKQTKAIKSKQKQAKANKIKQK